MFLKRLSKRNFNSFGFPGLGLHGDPDLDDQEPGVTLTYFQQLRDFPFEVVFRSFPFKDWEITRGDPEDLSHS